MVKITSYFTSRTQPLVLVAVFAVGFLVMALYGRTGVNSVQHDRRDDSAAVHSVIAKFQHTLQEELNSTATLDRRSGPTLSIDNTITALATREARPAATVWLVHALLRNLEVLSAQVRANTNLLAGGVEKIEAAASVRRTTQRATVSQRRRTTTTLRPKKPRTTKPPPSIASHYIQALGGGCIDVGPNGIVEFECKNSK